MKNLLRGKYSIFLLIAFIAFLYFVLNRGIVPWVMKATDSKVFVVEESEEEQLGKVKNQRTQFALINCKGAMKNESDIPDNAEFVDNEYQGWALGNRTYIIRSTLRINDGANGVSEKTFACKIRLTDGDETNPQHWSVLGIELHQPGEEN